MKKIYLAIPFTGMEAKSFKLANRRAAELMTNNIVFSPISMSYPIALENKLPEDWEFWKKFDEAFIEWCDILYVYCLPGWKDSKGVHAEIEIAKRLGKEIVYSDDHHN